jgi:hypothetical protein
VFLVLVVLVLAPGHVAEAGKEALVREAYLCLVFIVVVGHSLLL